MTLPIGSGFFTSNIPAKFSYSNIVTNKPQGIPAQEQRRPENAEYVKTSQQGEQLANQLFKRDAINTAQYNQTIYDKPSAQVSKAISAYTAFANLERRAEVQNLIGVDIYA